MPELARNTTMRQTHPRIDKDFMSRKEAARYLTENGYGITAQSLANLASNNNARKGPAFTRFGWKMVQYKRADLDSWLAARRTEFR